MSVAPSCGAQPAGMLPHAGGSEHPAEAPGHGRREGGVSRTALPGTGPQRTIIRAAAFCDRPGNRRRSSTAAAASPSRSKAARIAVTSDSSSANMPGNMGAAPASRQRRNVLLVSDTALPGSPGAALDMRFPTTGNVILNARVTGGAHCAAGIRGAAPVHEGGIEGEAARFTKPPATAGKAPG